MQLSSSELKKAQSLMLKILLEIDRVCKENDIKYFLSDGTLIGAIRHKGFIPWDDDLDIGMLRADYDKFCSIADKVLGDDFLLQSYNNDHGYGLSYNKVILKETLWLEKRSEKTNRKYTGLFVDIFPYDKIPNEKNIQKKIQYKYENLNYFILVKTNYYPLESNSFIKMFIKKIILKFTTLSYLVKKREKLIVKYKALDRDYLYTKFGGNFYKNITSPSNVEEYLNVEFENNLFPVPKGYDEVLTNLYGEYLVLPPKEKQQNHGIFDYDFGKYK